MKKHTTYLKKLRACSDAVEWASEFPSLQKAWDVCERGDWMLWLVGKQAGEPGSGKRRQFVLTACKCARLSLKCVPKGEKRPLKAIKTVEKWAKGDPSISLEDVRRAAYAAAAADAAADAAAYAAYAAYAAADAAARQKTLKKCANIVRKDYPEIRMI